MLLGPRRTPAPTVAPAGSQDVHQVLDELLLDGMTRQPCHVSFSGGRDSSVILAAATRVARREGLPDPIPLTARYPSHPATEESAWQKTVVDHLKLREWMVFDVTTELDVLGETAVTLLRRHGVYLPTPAHSMALFTRRLGAGSLVTGTGGDEVLSPWGHRRRSLRELVTPQRPRQTARRVAFEALPAIVRNRITVHRAQPGSAPWMRPAARRAVERAWRADPFWQDLTWRRALVAMLDFRSHEVTRATLETFARGEGVHLVEPFFDPRFVRAFARSGPRMGYASRTEAVHALFGGMLPAEVLERSTKAVFNTVFAGPRARAFAERWDGSGLAEDLIDPEALRAEWLRESPDVRTLAPLQLAWLNAQ